MRVAASAAAVAVGLCAVRTTAAGDRRAAGDTVVPGDPNSVLLVRSKARPPTAEEQGPGGGTSSVDACEPRFVLSPVGAALLGTYDSVLHPMVPILLWVGGSWSDLIWARASLVPQWPMSSATLLATQR